MTHSYFLHLSSVEVYLLLRALQSHIRRCEIIVEIKIIWCCWPVVHLLSEIIAYLNGWSTTLRFLLSLDGLKVSN